jgi:hypothetical protein
MLQHHQAYTGCFNGTVPDSVPDVQQDTTPDQDFEGEVERRGRMRLNGKSFVEGRPISADLDSTDELIVNMKEQGCSNEKIVLKLQEQGRVNYDKKTVGTRYIRIRAAITQRLDQQLDDELTDWHEGEVTLKYLHLDLALHNDISSRTKLSSEQKSLLSWRLRM